MSKMVCNRRCVRNLKEMQRCEEPDQLCCLFFSESTEARTLRLDLEREEIGIQVSVYVVNQVILNRVFLEAASRI